MREIPEELRSGPFRVERAREVGVSRKVADGARFRTAGPGVRILATDRSESLLDRCRAARLALPAPAAFSHGTAVRLGGWPTPMRVAGLDHQRDTECLQVSVPAGSVRPRFRGIESHRVSWLPGDVIELQGLRVTSPERTWCDLGAAGLDQLELVVLADAVRRRFGSSTPNHAGGAARLARRLEAWGGRRGARALRAALAASSDRVDAPTETRLRLLFAGAGLPTPEVNRCVYDEDGFPVHTPDLSWPEWMVGADYDGEHHFARDSDQQVALGRASNRRRRQDIGRLERMEEIGWTLRLFVAFDIFRGQQAAISRMREAFRQAGAPV